MVPVSNVGKMRSSDKNDSDTKNFWAMNISREFPLLYIIILAGILLANANCSFALQPEAESINSGEINKKTVKPKKPGKSKLPKAHFSASIKPHPKLEGAKAAATNGNYPEAARLFDIVARHYKNTKNWYAAADANLNEARCLIKAEEFAAAEKCSRIALDYLGKAHCSDSSAWGQYYGVLGTSLRHQSKYLESDLYLNSSIVALSKEEQVIIYEMAERSHELGLCMVMEGKMEQAEKSFRDSIDCFKRLSIPERRNILNTMISFAIYLNGNDRFSEAERICKEGLELGEKLGFNDSKQLADYKFQLAIAICGKPQEAETLKNCIEESTNIGEKAEGDSSWFFRNIRDLTDALIKKEQLELAIRVLSRSLAFAEKHNLLNNQKIPSLLCNMARCEIKLGNLGKATEYVKKASEYCAEHKGSNCGLDVESVRALIYHRQKNWDSELEALTQLYEMLTQFHPNEPDHPELLGTMRRLGNVHFQMGNHKEADHFFKNALLLEEKTKGPDHLSLSTPIQEIGSTYCISGRYTEAIPYLLRAIAIRDMHGDSSKGQYGLEGCLDELSYLYLTINEPDKALPLVERLFTLQDGGGGPAEGVDALSTMQSVAELLIQQGRIEEGNKMQNRITELRKTEKWKLTTAKPIEDPKRNLHLYIK